MAATSISDPNRRSASSSASLPALRWDVEFSLENSAGVFLRGETEYRFTGLAGETIGAVISRLNGHRSALTIAEKLNLPQVTVDALIEKLMDFDLVVTLPPFDDKVSSEKFTHICRHYFPKWKERLFSHPLWQQLGSGQATQAQFIGWLLESYHFIEGVNDRLALAVAECHDLRIREIFAHHYTEEYDHAKFFIDSLRALGLDETKIFSARPLPSTLAILNFMRQCARRDPLQYAVCSGFLESTGTDRIRARTFYAYLSEHYSADKTQVIDPLVDHVGLDESYGHNNLMESIVEILGDLPTRRASEALEAGAMLVETLELWSTDIQRSYDQDLFSIRSTETYYRPPTSTGGYISA